MALRSLIGGALIIAAFVGCSPKDSPSTRSRNDMIEQPPLIAVDDFDPEMMAAIEEARSTVEEFIKALGKPKPTQSDFAVKVAITDGDEIEHLWLLPVRYDDGGFIGRVNNEPQKVSTVNVGDEITVAKNEISDWIYIEDRRMVGGFTVHVLRAAMEQETPPESNEPIGDHELIGKWAVISIDNGRGSEAKEGFHLDITDATIKFIAPNGTTKIMGQLHRIDPTTSPKQIDLRNGDKIGLGIYELDGDSLKLIVRNPDSGRPLELKGDRDGMLFHLQRDRD